NDTWVTTPASVLQKAPTIKGFIHATVAERAANPMGQLTTPDDPTTNLAYLAGVVPDSIERVGKEAVRGTSTIHLRAQVDLHKLASTDPTAKAQAETIEQLTGTSTVPVEVWT